MTLVFACLVFVVLVLTIMILFQTYPTYVPMTNEEELKMLRQSGMSDDEAIAFKGDLDEWISRTRLTSP